MTTVFEKSDEWGGFTVKMGAAGFILEYYTHTEGEIDGLTILIPYGTWGFPATTDLEAPYDEASTNGEVLSGLAFHDAKLPIAERSVKVLNEGCVLDLSKPKKTPEVEAPVEVRRGVEKHDGEGGGTWYSLSLQKEDWTQYGKCHDLFTTMYLTHGRPCGMALWTTSNFENDENLFFAQIPEGVNIQEDRFFKELPLTQCEPPSEVGLALVVGPRRRPTAADSAASRPIPSPPRTAIKSAD